MRLRNPKTRPHVNCKERQPKNIFRVYGIPFPGPGTFLRVSSLATSGRMLNWISVLLLLVAQGSIDPRALDRRDDAWNRLAVFCELTPEAVTESAIPAPERHRKVKTSVQPIRPRDAHTDLPSVELTVAPRTVGQLRDGPAA